MNTDKLVYRAHDSSASHVRVWREGWFGDQFEVMSRDKFKELKRTVEALNALMNTPVVVLEEAEDNEVEINLD